MTCATHQLRLVVTLLAFFSGCGQSHEAAPDAAMPDAGPDAALPTCDPAPGIDLLDDRLPSEHSERPVVVPLRALALPDDGIAVLTFQRWDFGASPGGGVRRLLRLDGSGRLVGNVLVSRQEATLSATADVALVGDELWIAGLDRATYEEFQLWIARIPIEGTEVATETLEMRADPDRLVDGLVVLPAGGEADLVIMDAGRVLRYRVRATGYEEQAVLAEGFDSSSRVTGVREGALTCLAVRERSTGRLSLLRLDGDVVTDRRVLVDAGANFNPPVRIEDGDCVSAFFVPDPARPTQGSVHVSYGAAAITGWSGTAPFGLAFGDSSHSIFIATHDPEWPGQTSLYSQTLTDGACRVSEPVYRFPSQPGGGLSRGCLDAAGVGGARTLVLANVLAEGELAFARLFAP